MKDTNNVFDVFIIGGGINGAGIARDAAGRGLKTALVEAKDFGNATSSSSTKLIHGGLRYLEYYEFHLVRKALRERKKLMNIAPHIIWPLDFILPHEKHLRPKWLIKAGLFLYDFLAPMSILKRSKAVKLRANNPLKEDKKTGFRYTDCWVEDSRLVLINIRDAKEHGALISRNEKVLDVRYLNDDGLYLVTTNEKTYKAKVVVNAAGPWADQFWSENKNLRLVKGSHIIVPKQYEFDHAYILQNDDNRIVFTIPYEDDFTLIGTTDEEFKGDPYKVEISADETNYLIDVYNNYFTKQISKQDIKWSYSGVRPLLEDGADNASKVTRDYKFSFVNGRLDIFGGKLTTYRVLAKEAVDKIETYLNHKPLRGTDWTKDYNLPGGNFTDLGAFKDLKKKQYPDIDEKVLFRLIKNYGSDIDHILEQDRTFVVDGVLLSEIDYTIDHEWVLDAEDFLWRRTKLGLHLDKKQQRVIEDYIALKVEKKKAAA
ncbi:MAG: glycerol-3-phosphate dehydrogenase [Rickettsiales bacterium]|nr:glycerol-3-phosphate dehydrogenase [Rickettsiales bacterium]